MGKLVRRSVFAALALSGAVALPLAFASNRQERSDCPGKVVCPLTGEEVCRDQCPVRNTASPADIGAGLASAAETGLPSCCRQQSK